MMRTVVIGLGNPILSDDSVGIKASRLLKRRLQDMQDVDVMELHAGGLRLMDALTGYHRAIIIDAMTSGNCRPGTIRSLSLSDCGSARNMTCSHDTSLQTALKMGAMLGCALPAVIKIWGIEAQDVETFGEELTAAVRKAVPRVVRQVARELRGKVTV